MEIYGTLSSDCGKNESLNSAPQTVIAHNGKAPKPTREEHDRRVQLAADMLASGKSMPEIKQFLKKAFGLKFRSRARYLARARETLRSRVGETEDLRAASY